MPRTGRPPKPAVERFETKYEAVTESGCWIWTAGEGINRYGGFRYRQRSGKYGQFAHRFSYEHYKGPIPEGMLVCHRCDTPLCVNPDHLFLGTCKENLHDAIAKKRFQWGERNANAKLTLNDVLAIRSSGESSKVLASRYGVDYHHINQVRRGTAWKNAIPKGMILSITEVKV